jgi:hypothetical protein
MNHSTRLILFFTSSILTLNCLSIGMADDTLNRLRDAEKRGGWKLLFDGKTTDGWRNYRKPQMGSGWTVNDGILERTNKAISTRTSNCRSNTASQKAATAG